MLHFLSFGRMGVALLHTCYLIAENCHLGVFVTHPLSITFACPFRAQCA